MTVYIALLRGINVGGHNKIRMAELKLALEKIGLKFRSLRCLQLHVTGKLSIS